MLQRQGDVTTTRPPLATVPVLPLPLRVALFTDSYCDTNGVATFCREFVNHARGARLPFLCVHGGRQTRLTEAGGIHELQLRRSPATFRLDADVSCDPLLARHLRLASSTLRAFRPDLVHITGPGDASIVGLLAARSVGAPVVTSWHTNLHEYVDQRIRSSLSCFPEALSRPLAAAAARSTLLAASLFYRIGHFIAAPNDEMVSLLAANTGRPAFLMAHGVNAELFSPERRDRGDSRFTVGYVGRLSPEKNVEALWTLEQELHASGERDFRLLIVGDGSELWRLKRCLRTAEFTGILRGEALAAAFANMDVFVFPSTTDTFGLVVLEAMSSGVPVVLAPEAAKRAGVLDGLHGVHSRNFAASVRALMRSPETRLRMGIAARRHARAHAWQGVFEHLYDLYAQGLNAPETRRRMPTPRFNVGGADT